jgi:hypothetical protein
VLNNKTEVKIKLLINNKILLPELGYIRNLTIFQAKRRGINQNELHLPYNMAGLEIAEFRDSRQRKIPSNKVDKKTVQ